MSRRRNNAFGHQLTKCKRRKTTKKEVRNWLDLPRDIMILIFMKLGPLEILFNAQKVCSSWKKLASEPQLFRTIIVQYHELHFISRKSISSCKFAMFFMEALRRSCGQLVEISCRDFLSHRLLEYLVSKPNSLKTLRIGPQVPLCYGRLILIFERLPLLEELALFRNYYSENLFEVIGLCCPKLRHLRVDYRHTYSEIECEKQAFLIAKSMTHLRRLNLIGSKMSNKGLQAVLEGCPNLEYLDLRCCSKIKLEGNVMKDRISGIKKVRLPNEKIRDWYGTDTSGAPVLEDCTPF